MTARPKVLVIGLDCAEPSLVFDRYFNVLPHLKRLINTGVFARMRSSDPPITVPAWAVMMTGKDPGQLGFYGFRNRNSHD
jgi:predicted AlkP superfamily phosphohydrolase/phosphomutase